MVNLAEGAAIVTATIMGDDFSLQRPANQFKTD